MYAPYNAIVNVELLINVNINPSKARQMQTVPLGTVLFGTVLLNKKQRLNCKSLFYLQIIIKRCQKEPSPMALL